MKTAAVFASSQSNLLEANYVVRTNIFAEFLSNSLTIVFNKRQNCYHDSAIIPTSFSRASRSTPGQRDRQSSPSSTTIMLAFELEVTCIFMHAQTSNRLFS